MKVSLYNKTSFPACRDGFQKILNVAKKQLSLPDDEISVAILPLREMRAINLAYRGRASPTDVLAFDYGEILICPAYIKKKHHLKTTQEVIQKMRELFVHGLAHIAGYAHETIQQEKKMREVEEKIIARYCGTKQ